MKRVWIPLWFAHERIQINPIKSNLEDAFPRRHVQQIRALGHPNNHWVVPIYNNIPQAPVNNTVDQSARNNISMGQTFLEVEVVRSFGTTKTGKNKLIKRMTTSTPSVRGEKPKETGAIPKKVRIPKNPEADSSAGSDVIIDKSGSLLYRTTPGNKQMT